MAELLRQYFNIAFLTGRPQDLPAGERQLSIGVTLAFVTYVLALVSLYGVPRAALNALLDLGLTGVVLWSALRLMGHPGRFEQAFGGFCGAVAWLNVAAIPVYLGQTAEATGVSFAEFVLLVWNLSLLGHVIRHTFDTGLPMSILIAFVFVIILTGILTTLLPPLEPVLSTSAAVLSGS